MSKLKFFGNLFFVGLFFLLASLAVAPKISSAASVNLIANPSLEAATGKLPTGWLQDKWGTISATFTYPVAGHASAKAAKVTVSSFKSGDAKWYFKNVPVTPGNYYAFSDWSSSNVGTEVVAQFHQADGSDQYLGLGTVTGTNAWKQFSASFVVPSGTVSATVFHVIAAKGSLTVDDYSLIDNGPAPAFAEGMVTFAFDDGYESIYANGLPILDKAGIKSTQAIITTGTFTDPDYMTSAQVKTMAANGHEIASHSKTHPDLTTLSSTQAKTEIVGSKSGLAALGITANSFMYPYGAYNDAVVALVKGAGYVGARTTDEGYNTPLSNHYQILSQNVNNDVSIDTIKGWLDTAIKDKTWVVLTLHRQEKLDNIPDNLYANDPAILQQIVDYVKLKNMKTVTFGQGVSMLAK